ncbi:SDR family oxidoreductase [Paraglaciecola arctica]|uniref:SDR family oxidoreductase n=1 Tax=Paraglaciecola arctica TaxID=1128911 RepID=UPI001C07D96A|nr:SDR family NAD(P)-dependent oxidoreductase [Paraglaciecola arctica]MBU3003178.1 SDR family NAD(P)-dependent oxidoreductase [Paraglaciecola arctica]
MILTNKRIVITGGTSGIGLEIVHQLAIDNKLIVVGRNTKVLQSLNVQYPMLETHCCDLSCPSDVSALVQCLLQKHRSLDVLINNAAMQYSKKMTDQDYDPAAISTEINTNLTAVCLLSHGLLPLLQRVEKAVVLNVNSGLALAPKASSAVYCATKAAINSFSQSLNHQLKDSHVAVLQAFMPVVDTPMTEGRGSNKISSHFAAQSLLTGIRESVIEHDIGKVKLLRWLLRIVPSVAKRIMVNA